MSVNGVDLILRCLALTVAFFLLIYLFHEKIVIEGFIGYATVLCLLVPANVYLNSGGHLPGIGASGAPTLSMMLAILAFNIVLGLILNKALPALTVSSYPVLILFLVLFSMASNAVHYLPQIPVINPSF